MNREQVANGARNVYAIEEKRSRHVVLCEFWFFVFRVVVLLRFMWLVVGSTSACANEGEQTQERDDRGLCWGSKH
jgi:hypothetical protein